MNVQTSHTADIDHRGAEQDEIVFAFSKKLQLVTPVL